MQDMIGYVQEYQKYTFKAKPFNHVDALILAQLSYIHFEETEYFKENHQHVSIQDIAKSLDLDELAKSILNGGKNGRLLLAVASSLRYQKLQVNYYVNEIDEASEKQFSAVTFFMEHATYIVFRGTDSTFVGWKEDFNLMYMPNIPSQVAGLNYLESILENLRGRIIVGGHSKGGNIAMYASIHCKKELQKKIDLVYSFDGPGFSDNFMQTKSYQTFKKKIIKLLPQSSMIGIMFEKETNYIVVKSNNIWITQHDPFSWEINEGDFIYLTKPSRKLMNINKKLNAWIETLEMEERAHFVETVYEIFNSAQATTIEEFTSEWKTNSLMILKQIKNTDNKTKKYIISMIASMLKYVIWDSN